MPSVQDVQECSIHPAGDLNPTFSPGNDFFPPEFHLLIFVVLIGIVRCRISTLVFIIHILSLVYQVYGGAKQHAILVDKMNLVLDERNIAKVTQNEAWGYLYEWTMTWISSTVYCATIIRLWWREDFQVFAIMRRLNCINWICILNAFTAVFCTSLVEYWFTLMISKDWELLMYLSQAFMCRLIQRLYQGHLYVFRRGSLAANIHTLNLGPFNNTFRTIEVSTSGVLAAISNVFLLLMNTGSLVVGWIFFYNTIGNSSMLQIRVAICVLSVVFTIDIIYRLILIKNCIVIERLQEHVPFNAYENLDVHTPTVQQRFFRDRRDDRQTIPVSKTVHRIQQKRPPQLNCRYHATSCLYINIITGAQSQNIVYPIRCSNDFDIKIAVNGNACTNVLAEDSPGSCLCNT